MVYVDKLILLLSEILDAESGDFMMKKVLEFNSKVLESDEETGIEDLDQFLVEFGYDLEFFESNPFKGANYYGPQELKLKVSKALDKIRSYT